MPKVSLKICGCSLKIGRWIAGGGPPSGMVPDSSIFTVYILEGDAVQRAWLRRVLTGGRWRCVGAGRTVEAALLAFPRRAPGPDVLLLGRCPGDSYEVAVVRQWFDLLHPCTRLVVLGGWSVRPAELTRHLPKPFTRTQLLEILRETVEVKSLP